MPADYVERVGLVIGGQSLDSIVNSIDETIDGGGVKTVKTMNKQKRAQGYKAGNREFKFDLNCERIDPATGLPDWEQMVLDGTLFDTAVVPSVGDPYTYKWTRAVSVNPSASDGDSSLKVSCVALDRR